MRVDLAIAYSVEGSERREARCSDLSLGGAYVEVDGEVPAFGSKITVFLALPDKEIDVDATVRWVKPDGMGLQFGLLDARDTYALTEYLADLEPIPDSRLMAID